MNVSAIRDGTRGAALDEFFEINACLPQAMLERLVELGEVLEYKKPRVRPSVLRVPGPDRKAVIVKLWYGSGKLNSDRLSPYNARFRRNARRLRQLDLAAPDVIGWGRIRSTRIRFVSYLELSGRPLDRHPEDLDFTALAGYLSRLHDAGVDFRGLHLGNLLFDSGAGFSLIDVSDCRFLKQPLSLSLRARRLARFCSHGPEQDFFATSKRWSKLVLAYCEVMGLSLTQTTRLHDRVRARLDLPVSALRQTRIWR